MRRIPPRYAVVWTILAALFAAALFSTGTASWILSGACLGWFAIWESLGIASKRKADTLSESVWALLDVENHRPVNRALFPLVMGVFSAAAVLFIGFVEGVADLTMHTIPRVVAASLVAAGTLGFLVRHFRRGDSR